MRRLLVGRNLKRDAWSTEIDVVLEVDLASTAALDAYKRHPIYLAGIDRIRPLRDLRFAVDYDLPADELAP